VSELGEPISVTPNGNEDALNLASAVKEIEDAWNKISRKEGELKALETKLENRCEELNKQDENIKRFESIMKTDRNRLSSSQNSFYETLCGYLKRSHCETGYICSMGYDFWIKLIDEIFNIGAIIGKSNEEVISQHACELIGIYDYFKLYDKAYAAMVIMAETNGYWVCIKRDTILWAKNQYIIFKIKDAIKNRINDYSKYVDRDDYRKRLKEINDILG
jgi:hypothetical protein